MKEIYRKFINKMLKNLDELILRLIKYFKNFSKSKTGIDYGGIKQNIKNNEGLTITEARRISSELGFTHRTTKTQGQEPAHQLKKTDNGETRQNIKNNEDVGLTITEARRIESELGFMNRPTKTLGQEPRIHSKIIFKKDMAKKRDMEFKEQIIQEIMENRKVSREEAVGILANPW